MVRPLRLRRQTTTYFYSGTPEETNFENFEFEL